MPSPDFEINGYEGEKRRVSIEKGNFSVHRIGQFVTTLYKHKGQNSVDDKVENFK